MQASGKIVPRERGRVSALRNLIRKTGFVVPDKRAQRALIRDPSAVAVTIERAGGRPSLNNSGRRLWVPAQGRDDEWRGLRRSMGTGYVPCAIAFRSRAYRTSATKR